MRPRPPPLPCCRVMPLDPDLRWDRGDWTDDTDQMILILQMIVEGEGKVDRCAFAAKMRHWMHNGFKELGDLGE